MTEVTKTASEPLLREPLILGVITARMLKERHYPETAWECDGIELRADGLPAAEILSAVEAFSIEKKRRGFAGKIVFTLRLRRDGGMWNDAEARNREAVWLALANHPVSLCDLADIEIQEAATLNPQVWDAFQSHNVKVILSHHAFAREDSSVWENHFKAMRAFNPDAVKFAVTVSDAKAAAVLLRLARKVAGMFPLSCVISMGDAGQVTRIVSPLLGCPITYAFLENGPVAPGQLSLKVLRKCFAQTRGRPTLEASEEEWIDWAAKQIRENNSDAASDAN